MQSGRRYFCSTACQSSPSNISIRTCKKSRTSSGGGESLVANRDPGAVGDVSEARPNNRLVKTLLRPTAKNSKNSRKDPKTSAKVSKQNFGSLQNAVVLAPFHTLKRCFQNKLVDLYSYEKMKKVNQKAKMAKKRNMSFEYDVVEIETLKSRVEKETPQPKENPKRKSRSPSYCQCKKVGLKIEENLALNKSNKTNAREILPSKAPCFSGQSVEAKRKKFDRELVMETSNLKPDLCPRRVFYPPHDHFHFSDANQSSSAVSSKCDSWESYSNPPSCKEEHIQGSLAVSTTSFDSYLENFEKGSWEFAESSNKNSRREEHRKRQEPHDPDFVPKPSAQYSSPLASQVDGKNSDGNIVDFMDREPKSQRIPSVESSQQWQPLRRQSKASEKKSEEEGSAGYNLRSLSTGAQRDFRREGRSHVPKRGYSYHIEVATQVGGNVSEDGCSADLYPERPAESREHVPQESLEVPEEPPNHLNPSLEIRYEGADNGGRSDMPSMENEQFEESAGVHQPREEESSFVFGAGNNANMLEETCEHRFGSE